MVPLDVKGILAEVHVFLTEHEYFLSVRVYLDEFGLTSSNTTALGGRYMGALQSANAHSDSTLL